MLHCCLYFFNLDADMFSDMSSLSCT